MTVVDLTQLLDREKAPCCPICDCLIIEYEPAIIAYIHDRKCLVHQECVESNVHCSKAPDSSHCWHGVCVDVDDARKGKEQCCWCGSLREYDNTNKPERQHGKHVPFKATG